MKLKIVYKELVHNLRVNHIFIHKLSTVKNCIVTQKNNFSTESTAPTTITKIFI